MDAAKPLGRIPLLAALILALAGCKSDAPALKPRGQMPQDPIARPTLAAVAEERVPLPEAELGPERAVVEGAGDLVVRRHLVANDEDAVVDRISRAAGEAVQGVAGLSHLGRAVAGDAPPKLSAPDVC